MNDLRIAIRQLLKAPAFTGVAVVTLALGIGACAAIFSVVDRVLLRPPPLPEPDRVLVFHETSRAWSEVLPVTSGRYQDWVRQATSFQSIGAMMRTSSTLTGGGDPVKLKAARVTASALSTLRVVPLLGRSFLAAEEAEPNQENVAMLGYSFWRERFGGRADILGQSIRVNGRPFTVVGVLPRTTALPSDIEVFAPLGFSEDDRGRYTGHWLSVFGRLKPGITTQQAQGEMNAIAERTARTHPASQGWGVKLVPIVEASVGEVRPVLLSLAWAVGFLLLIACANVANLLLARATARSREVAVRTAMGATRARIIRQLLTESVLLSLLGGLFGVLVAQGGVEALMALAPEALPQTAEITVDGRVLVFTLVLAVGTGIGFGLVPAFHGTLQPLSRFCARPIVRRRRESSGRGYGAPWSSARWRSRWCCWPGRGC